MVASDAAARVVVCDAGPLIHLDEMGRIDLLGDFGEVLVPTAVWNEVTRHRPSALAAAGVPLRRVSAGSTLAPDLEVLARTFRCTKGNERLCKLRKNYTRTCCLQTIRPHAWRPKRWGFQSTARSASCFAPFAADA